MSSRKHPWTTRIQKPGDEQLHGSSVQHIWASATTDLLTLLGGG